MSGAMNMCLSQKLISKNSPFVDGSLSKAELNKSVGGK